jgi:hypothetical protein
MPGFWTRLPNGSVLHVRGDRHMPAEDLAALHALGTALERAIATITLPMLEWKHKGIAMSAPPPEVTKTLSRLARQQEPITVTMKPWDAWVTVAVIQFASRNPQLSPTQKDQAVAVGRALQAMLAQLSPEAAQYLEAGWNPELDVSE